MSGVEEQSDALMSAPLEPMPETQQGGDEMTACEGETESETESVKQQREEDAEERRRIEKPWLYETQRPMIDPPNINFRGLIVQEQEAIDQLLENNAMHFTERCWRYQEVNIYTEI